MYLFYKSPFENLNRHAEKVGECAQLFLQAMKSWLSGDFETFEKLTDQVAKLESEADEIKRNIRGHMPRGILMPVDKFQYFMYLREQDKVLDAVEESLLWLSYMPGKIEGEVAEDLLYLAERVIPAIEKLLPLVDRFVSFLRTRSKEERLGIKSMIRDIRQHEHEADHVEQELMRKIFSDIKDPLTVFYLIRVVGIIGAIADHAQNASDMMRAMVAE
jgi:predicted phosphate transport protein (TIGR00153 family)